MKSTGSDFKLLPPARRSCRENGRGAAGETCRKTRICAGAIWRRTWAPALALIVLMAGAPAGRGQGANPDLFSRAKMQEVDLTGLRLWLGQPVQVTAQVGWQMSWSVNKNWYTFIHLTPYLARFPNGELIATYTLDPDAHDDPVTASAFQISKDGGADWERRYSMLMYHVPLTFIPKPNNSLLALPSWVEEQTPGDEHNFVGAYYLFEHGGDRMTFVPDGFRLVDWPFPPEVYRSPQPRNNWHVGIVFTGNTFEAGGKLLATGYFRKRGEDVYSAVIFASEDGGYTWRYFSTVAGPDPALVKEKAYEGANEMTVIKLADGDLMAVFRVGSGRKWNLQRAYSHDGARTWSKPDVLPAWSVEPQLMRTANGTIALSTGRPGIDLWLSTDPRATTWQSIDIVQYHNRCMSDPSERISSFKRDPVPYVTEDARWQTTAYTAMVEVAPNRLLLIYDRDPERAPADPSDLSRVYVLPVEIERN